MDSEKKIPQALNAAGDELIGSRSGDGSRGVEAHVCTQGRRETQGRTGRTGSHRWRMNLLHWCCLCAHFVSSSAL